MKVTDRINRLVSEDGCVNGEEWCPIDKKCVPRGTGKGRGKGQGKNRSGGGLKDGSGGGEGKNRRK